jgi:hypothetical protein
MMFYSLKRIFLKHDPEKWTPVFRKDHAQTQKGQGVAAVPSKAIVP